MVKVFGAIPSAYDPRDYSVRMMAGAATLCLYGEGRGDLRPGQHRELRHAGAVICTAYVPRRAHGRNVRLWPLAHAYHIRHAAGRGMQRLREGRHPAHGRGQQALLGAGSDRLRGKVCYAHAGCRKTLCGMDVGACADGG